MSEHTKEPWVADLATYPIMVNSKTETWPIVDELGNEEGRTGAFVCNAGANQENARRIVACVNACTGIPTKELEKTGTIAVECRDEAQEELLKAWKQRDELKQQNERLFAKLRYYQSFVVMPRVGPVATIPCGVSGPTSVYMPSPIKLDELLTQRDELLSERDKLKADLERVIDEANVHAQKLAEQRDELLAALKATRGQWIHSVNANQCLAVIAKAEGHK